MASIPAGDGGLRAGAELSRRGGDASSATAAAPDVRSEGVSGAGPRALFTEAVGGGGPASGGGGTEGAQDRGPASNGGGSTQAVGGGGAQGSGWVRRPRFGSIPDERVPQAGRVSAYEQSLRNYAEKKSGVVMNPAVGTSFDSRAEAYEFYNLYSWELGFGIRWNRNAKNSGKSITKQDICCSCQGKPDKANSASVRTGCKAMIRLLRSNDNGWYIKEFRADHNHPLSGACIEKSIWPCHKHLDPYTKDLVLHLRNNNIDLSKINCIIAGFFGSMQNFVLDSKERFEENRNQKLEFHVIIRAEDCAVICECGLGEHMGMPCCHAVKVMIHLGMQELPSGNIVRRWTRNARDISLDHLIEHQEDMTPGMLRALKYAALYVAAMEVVNLGLSSNHAFQIAMTGLTQAKQQVLEASRVKDGIGLAEQRCPSAEQGSGNSSDVQDVSAVTTDDATSAAQKLSLETKVPGRKRKLLSHMEADNPQ
ncbi:hypothetical protein EJB05_15391 [Eragrostis curvula]|uniref:SWIM-type domain-containing protein n=1 Tax=Eragrostis curvula TaxID=38414 RepID=A0A5J9W1U2_9POAL|nr:hypothetical protein EJB05_15391 [Eragrostis curvula]